MKKTTIFLLLSLFIALADQAPAAVIELTPAVGVTQVGNSITFDVMVSETGIDNIGSFGFDLFFPEFLTFDSLTFSPYLGNEAAGEVENYYAVLPQNILLYGSYSYLTDAELDLLQPATPFSLASMTFTGNGEGFDELNMVNVSLNDAFGDSMNPVIFGDSFVFVDPVPLPGAVWMLGAGLLGLFGNRLRKKEEAV